MKRETTYIAANIMDRYMASEGMFKELTEQMIQEIAATCLYIAAKIEEI